MKLVTLILMFAMAAMAAASETAAQKKLSFEVASVKPVQVAGPPLLTASAIAISGETVKTRGNVLTLMMAAYSLSTFQISTVPDWAKTQWYEINAKAAGMPSMDDARQMLQTLLVDRFQLKTHWETREMPVYNLVVAKSGLKIKPSVDQTPPAPVQDTGQRGFAIDASGKQARGTFAMRQTPNGIINSWTATAFSFVVSLMQTQADRLIIDRTQLTGLFDVQYELRRDDSLSSGGAVGQGPAATAPRSSGLPIMEEQFGLKLEPAKAGVQLLVVDSVQRPSEN